MNGFELTPISDDELTNEFGNHRRANVDDCFRDKQTPEHYYMQRENDVLHINTECNLINSLHNSSLGDHTLEKVSNEEFDDKIRNIVFELGLYKYCMPRG